MPSALVFLPEGAEATSLVICLDVLRHGGFEVTLAGLNGMQPHACSMGVKFMPDVGLEDVCSDTSSYDVVICPGGRKGAENMSMSQQVCDALKSQDSRGGYIAAMCAGPNVLIAHGIGKGKCATGHPLEEEKLSDYFQYSSDRVVFDGKLLTCQGAATSFEFSLALVEHFQGKEKAVPIKQAMLCR